MEQLVLLITFDKAGKVETIMVTASLDWAVKKFQERVEQGLSTTITNYSLGEIYKLDE